MAVLETLARFAWLLLGLLVPGDTLLQALRLPRSIAAAFATSAVLLYGWVVVLTLVRMPISPGALSVGLILVTITAAIVGRVRTARGYAPPANETTQFIFFSGLGRWLPLYLAFWAIVLWRLCTQPLSGPDTEFRWSWLAEQMLRHGSLDFYPPRTAADFESYFWVESLPPGVASLYAWAYACAGKFDPVWTAPVVLLQFWSIHELLWRVANEWIGPSAARMSCLVAAATPLLNWSILIGQETGLTTLALLGMMVALLQFQRRPETPTAIVIGIFATLGAATREYGPVFPLFGFVALLAFRVPRHAVLVLVAGGALSAAWMARTWILTGNPVYSLEVGNLFPRNELFSTWRAHDRGLNGTMGNIGAITSCLRLLLLFAPAAFAGWVLLLRPRTSHRPLFLAAVLAFLVLWVASVPYTSGGLFYSLRVTAPALAIGAIVTGSLLAQAASRWVGPVVAILLLATLPQTLTLPQNAWHVPWSEWAGLAAAHTTASAREQEALAIIAAVESKGPVVADNPGFQARLQSRGFTFVPPWSPQASWLFDPKLPAADVVRHWQAAPMRFILLARFPPTLEFIQTHARWSTAPLAYRIKWQNDDWVLFELALRNP